MSTGALIPDVSLHSSGMPTGSAPDVSRTPSSADSGPKDSPPAAWQSSSKLGPGLTRAMRRMFPLGMTVAHTISETSSLSETFRTSSVGPSDPSAFNTNSDGSVAGVAPPGSVGLAPSRAPSTTNFITLPVVPGSAGAKSTPGSPPPKGSSGPILSNVTSVPYANPLKYTMTSARTHRAMSSGAMR